jgi:biotin carboxylase
VRVFEQQAKRIGFEVVLATDRCHVLDDPWGDGAVALRFSEPERAAEIAARQGSFDGIAAVGDQPAYVASFIARRLGLRFSPPEAVNAARNKFLARERFRAAGLSVPSYFQVPLVEDPAVAARRATFPCVLKPLGLSASRGVIRANNDREFVSAFERIRRILASPDVLRNRETQDQFLQVESFITGREYALEGILSHGRLKTIAIFDKPDPLDGPFFEETIYTTPSREPAELQERLESCTRRGVEALGLTDGPVHAEMRSDGTSVYLLEIAPRPIGGLCAQAIRSSLGQPLEEMILRHAAGDDVSTWKRESAASGVMMIPIPAEGVYTRVEGVEAARGVPGIEDIIITAKEGHKLTPLPEASTYLGFIFARALTSDLAEAALRDAHARLEFQIAGALPVVR